MIYTCRCGTNPRHALCSYDFQVINICRTLLEDEFPATDKQRAMLTSAALLGSVVGQLAFGAAADVLGRRGIFIATAIITALASLGAACAWDSPRLSIYAMLSLWRFMLGFGIGGEYPLSAAHTAEGTDSRGSGRAMALVYLNMGLGSVAAPLVVVALMGSGLSRQAVWRAAFGLGALLSAVGAGMRWNVMTETEAFQNVRLRLRATSENGGGRSSEPEAAQQQHAPSRLQVLARYWRPLLGTAVSWFLYDSVDYGLGLYTADFDSTLGLKDDDYGKTLGVLYIALLTLPGYGAGVLLVDRLGRRGCQLLGFFGMAAMFFVLVALWEPLSKVPALFLLCYSVQVAFDALGPGMTTYVVPGEIYPTLIRASAHGISAASGKAGAVLGTAAFPRLQSAVGLRSVLLICGCICLFSAVWTLVFTPNYDAATLAAQRTAEERGDVPDPRALYRRRRRHDAGSGSSGSYEELKDSGNH